MTDFRCSYIVAASYPDLVIGDRQTNQLLWRIPEDMARFREITMGSIVIMGRRTFDSLPGRKPLVGRVNIVLTRNVNGVNRVEGVHFCDMSTVFDIVKQYIDKPVFVIGGEDLYRLFWEYCTCLYITFVKPLHIENVYGNNVVATYAKFPDVIKLPNEDIFEDTDICRSYKGIKYVFMTMSNL